jgi:hypothetical protein
MPEKSQITRSQKRCIKVRTDPLTCMKMKMTITGMKGEIHAYAFHPEWKQENASIGKRMGDYPGMLREMTFHVVFIS